MILGKRVMSNTEALMTLIFGVCLPSWDVYSDFGFAYYLYSKGHPNFGTAMICPIFLAMGFILPQWWQIEGKTSTKNKIGTFCLVLIQFWPQWKMLQVLYLGLIKKDANWRKEKEMFNRNIGSLGEIHQYIFFVTLHHLTFILFCRTYS